MGLEITLRLCKRNHGKLKLTLREKGGIVALMVFLPAGSGELVIVLGLGILFRSLPYG